MEPQWDRLEDLPLRFVVPDGWREPHPEWVSLHQGFIPPEGWQPYPECTPAPPQWPFWEENGAAWYSFFRYHAPPPSRAIGLVVCPQRSGALHRDRRPICSRLSRVCRARSDCSSCFSHRRQRAYPNSSKEHTLGGKRPAGACAQVVRLEAGRVLSRGLRRVSPRKRLGN